MKKTLVAMAIALTIAASPVAAYAQSYPVMCAGKGANECYTWVAEVRGEVFTGTVGDRTSEALSAGNRASAEREARISAAYAWNEEFGHELRYGTNDADGFDIGITKVHPRDVHVISVSK